VTRHDGTVVRRADDVIEGDPIQIHLIDGTVSATVTRKGKP
jgi:exonuclease VII large subunit